MEVATKQSLLEKKYPAKLLLFGEHLILEGASSLAVPFHHYCAYWSKGDSCEPLDDFYDHLSTLPFINRKSLLELRESGYYLESDIPRGYGLGSSGALCAAAYEWAAYPFIEKSSSDIINELAQVENFFHGKSSGLDAYVVLKNEPVLVVNGIPQKANFNLASLPFQIFLIDSGIPRKSKELIGKFVNKKSGTESKLMLREINDILTTQLSQENYKNIMPLINEISKLQFQVLDYMIVDSLQTIWKDSLEKEDLCIKLCGAGGGGFYLGFSSSSKPMDIPLGIIQI